MTNGIPHRGIPFFVADDVRYNFSVYDVVRKGMPTSMRQGFDNEKYIELQAANIRKRIAQFGGKLYLEFGGKLFDDYHASRVLPGFEPDTKFRMLESLVDDVEIVIAINANHIEKGKTRGDLGIPYDEDVLRLIDVFRSRGFLVGSVVLTQYANQPAADAYRHRLEQLGVTCRLHYPIAGYPHDIERIVSDDGYGKNEYIETTRPLVVVTAPGPGSGKLATCLSQLYHDDLMEARSVEQTSVFEAAEYFARTEGILPAPEDARQRRKVIFNVAEQNGHPVAGFYRARSHEVVPVPDCPAVPKEALACEQTVLDWMEREHIPVYDEAAKRDGVRHIFYRSSHLTEKAVLTLTASRSPGEKALGILTDMLRERCPDVTGLVLNRNTARGNTVLAGEFDTVWGSEVLTEGLCGLTFMLSPRSFFQVNPPQAERLYEAALGYAGITPGMTALDLYCGTGTIGLCMASRGARVIGAEVIPAAVENARDNAKRNHLSDECEFLCADAGEAAAELARRGIRPQVIVVDPPRRGLDESVISHAVGMQPERIVYVSCDPGTLARDLASFARQGYTPAAGIAVDMFPRTSHVETVCLLVLRNPVTHINIDVDVEEMVQDKRGLATYEQIKDYVLEHSGLKVSSLYIAQVKQKCGIIERENYNKPKSENAKQPQCPPEKERAITEALKHFGMI